MPPQDAWLEDIGQWVRWGPEPILVQKGPPLALFREALMEVEDGSTSAQEVGAVVEEKNSAMAE